VSKIFQKLELEAFRAGITPRTRESREWFRKRAQDLRRINRRELMREEPLRTRNKQIIGSMQMFFYDPKTKDTLPYYDKFPLTIIVGPAEKGFYGLNLHYLPPTLRAKFLDALMEISDQNIDENSKFKARYRILTSSSKLRYFKPCFKRYLTTHVKSQFAEVPAPEWEIAAFLPTASWSKANANEVYRDSRKAI
jgi:hypothetical protein